MTVKSSISLSDEHHAFARAQVQDGRFASVSAVVQHGLDLLRQRAEAEQLTAAASATDASTSDTAITPDAGSQTATAAQPASVAPVRKES